MPTKPRLIMSSPPTQAEKVAAVQAGVDAYGKAELGIQAGIDALQLLGPVYVAAAQVGIMSGHEALQTQNKFNVLAGDLAKILTTVLNMHKRGTALAQAAGCDVTTPYAGVGVHPMGGPGR